MGALELGSTVELFFMAAHEFYAYICQYNFCIPVSAYSAMILPKYVQYKLLGICVQEQVPQPLPCPLTTVD
jgi:hypothetical protein